MAKPVWASEHLGLALDTLEVENMLALGEQQFGLAAAGALNKSVMKVRTAVARQIGARAQIAPLALVRRRLKVDRARPHRMEAVIRVLITDIPVIRLSRVRQTKRKGGGVAAYGDRMYPGAFIATGTGNYEQVFRRTGEFGTNVRGRYAGKVREKINALKVPVATVAHEVIREQIGLANDYLAEILPREIAYRMNRGL